MRLATILLAAGAAAVSTLATGATTAPLPPAPPPGTGLAKAECIHAHEIRTHAVADNRTLLVDVAGKGTYRLTMRNACLSAAVSSDAIVTRSPPGSGSICKPNDLDLAMATGPMLSQCVVDSIVRMTPSEVAALPRRMRP